jgi:hypothetical protein
MGLSSMNTAEFVFSVPRYGNADARQFSEKERERTLHFICKG